MWLTGSQKGYEMIGGTSTKKLVEALQAQVKGMDSDIAALQAVVKEQTLQKEKNREIIVLLQQNNEEQALLLRYAQRASSECYRKDACKMVPKVVAMMAECFAEPEETLKAHAFKDVATKSREKLNGINTVIKKQLGGRYANVNDLDIMRDVPLDECFDAIVASKHPELNKDLLRALAKMIAGKIGGDDEGDKCGVY